MISLRFAIGNNHLINWLTTYRVKLPFWNKNPEYEGDVYQVYQGRVEREILVWISWQGAISR